ncbi:MAG: hypothetical protein IPJ48_08025 [Propionivibrio sp.]|uniref:Uncharacterized protein n=1 Tax=Candidatus Propionivibrio dominans TaxID=2954373 RepID=A0A9D7I789_9RHOO|nr:hypothetical protein [Candidatus Propionivibrio dominans]MBL0168545.1 hypothetical protein [Propionivibrio sp.]
MANQAQETKDAGVLAVIVARMEQQRLPRAIDLKAKVEQGGVLDDLDIEFLEGVFADSSELKPLLVRHPEYQDLAARMMALYREITTKALENENK